MFVFFSSHVSLNEALRPDMLVVGKSFLNILCKLLRALLILKT